MKSTDPDDYQHVPRPVATMPSSYPAGHEIALHTHARAQLLLATNGAIEITVDGNIWVVPHGRAVWIPAGIEHTVYIISAVTIESLYIDATTETGMNDDCQVVAVSPLLQALIAAAMAIPVEYDPGGRDGLIMQLILAELKSMPFVPLHIPMPRDRRLQIICQAISQQPGRSETLAQWGVIAGATARTLANRFRAETGLTFGQWRQQARLMEAIRRLAINQPVSVVARDLGYRSESAFIAMFRRTLGATPARYFSGRAVASTQPGKVEQLLVRQL